MKIRIKKLALLMLFVSASTSAFANNNVPLNNVELKNIALNNVTLNKVTLFLQGAELQGHSTIAIAKGESEVLLTGVADGINPNSINIGLGNSSDAMILATTLKNNYLLKNEESDELKSLRDKLKQLEAEYQKTEIQFTAVSETIALLQGNRMDGLVKNNPDMLTDMKNVLDFVQSNLASALTDQYTLQTQLDDLNKQISQYQSQIEQDEGTSRQVSNVIAVKIYSDKDVKLPVTVSYVTQQAGWMPIYDVRVADINSPLQLTYKANVYQRSGLDWNNIDFSLSTANPSEGITAPTLSPWRIDMYKEKSSSFFSKSVPEKDDYFDEKSEYKIRAAQPMADNVITNNTGVNTKFDVKLPYTIKSNSDNNLLTLQDKEVKAEYRYISTPKLDNYAFLQAQIVDWDKLNLLPGKSTVFFAGNYMGESFITTQDVKDKLSISLGRDKNILIARNRDLNETSKPSFFGNEVSQKYAYTIDVKNSKTLPIDIVIYDQLPVIQNKVVAIEEAKYDGASYDKETGLLTWELPLKQGEAKTLKLSFKLTYPKDKTEFIIGL